MSLARFKRALASAEDSMKLRDVMRTQVVTASSAESAAEVWDRMRAMNADYVVVTEAGDVVGILSWHDL